MPQPFDSELGAFVDEICADLCRVECAATVGCPPGQVSVEREVALGSDASADIRVEAPGAPPFFVENKLAYAPADLVARLRRKYGQPSPAWRGAGCTGLSPRATAIIATGPSPVRMKA